MMICSSTNWESSFLTWKICTKSMPLARRNTKLGNSVCGPQTGLLAEPTWLRSRVWCSGLWALSWCNFWGWCRLEERQSVSQYENTEAPQIKQNSLNSRTTCFNLRIYCNYRNHTLLYLDPVDFSFFFEIGKILKSHSVRSQFNGCQYFSRYQTNMFIDSVLDSHSVMSRLKKKHFIHSCSAARITDHLRFLPTKVFLWCG